MTEITLTDEQTQAFASAREKVVFRDLSGKMIGVVDPFEAVALARHRERAGKPHEPGIPAEVVSRQMKTLQMEWDRTGGFDEEYMFAFLANLTEADAK